MELRERVGIVTGGGVRVGRAIALGLAAAGADVFVHYNRSAGPAEETAAQARELGVRAAAGSVDLSDPSRAGDLVDLAVERLGTPSILVNSASGFPTDTIRDVTLENWCRTFDLTLASPVFATQAFADALPMDLQGAVVNITDVRTHRPYREHFSYIVAKGGIDAFTRTAALQLAPRIRVNAVALGVILPPPGEGDDYATQLAEELPLAKVGGTEPVVAAVLSLLGNDFVTGEIVRVDGGGHLV
jgi:NAD(P)-dependent dehydrogenase (short-subunit alcohol dehydrogenase family)